MTYPGVEQYRDPDGRIAAVVLRSRAVIEGIAFFTPLEQTQQLGLMRRPKGYQVEPHEHTRQERYISDTNEVLFVRSGRIQVTLYDSRYQPHTAFLVGPSEAVLLASGGHGITFVEESDVIEVKQGPYTEIADKKRFQPES